MKLFVFNLVPGRDVFFPFSYRVMDGAVLPKLHHSSFQNCREFSCRRGACTVRSSTVFPMRERAEVAELLTDSSVFCSAFLFPHLYCRFGRCVLVADYAKSRVNLISMSFI